MDGYFSINQKLIVLMLMFLCTFAETSISADPINSNSQATFGLPPVPVPDTNPQTPQKIALGKKLFFDKRLSADGTISCATCHKPEKAFTDGIALAQGIYQQHGTRNTPTLINAAYFTTQFWDGRRQSLEEQAQDPLVNPREHGLAKHEDVLNIIRQDSQYRIHFREIFGIEPIEISLQHIVNVLAVYERTLLAGNSPFDRYYYGGDIHALSPSAIRGLSLFLNQARCAKCHTIGKHFALFTDNAFHHSGVGFDRIQNRLAEITTTAVNIRKSGPGSKLDGAILSDADISELGRFMVSYDPQDLGRFKTPTLRNIALTAPYMHDGSLNKLEEVVEVELYIRGNEPNRPVILTPREKADLVEFLKSLTSPNLPQ